MISLSPGNSQSARAADASVPPLPGGYALQEISSQTVSLLERTGVPMPEILVVTDKFFAKIKRTGVLRKKEYWGLKAFEKITPILCRNPDDVKILVFVLVTNIDRVRNLVDLGRDCLLSQAASEFSKLQPGEFGKLSFEASCHFSIYLFNGGRKGGRDE